MRALIVLLIFCGTEAWSTYGQQNCPHTSSITTDDVNEAAFAAIVEVLSGESKGKGSVSGGSSGYYSFHLKYKKILRVCIFSPNVSIKKGAYFCVHQ
ncbi:hypothetical protein Y032_0009g680 [Ancylostoma ceylanicum]|nr:hypothetical protein Y032_0009g680 [Ancylostoma ceylanicum]